MGVETTSESLFRRAGHVYLDWEKSFSRSSEPPSRLSLFALIFAWSGILHQFSFSDWIRDFLLIEWINLFICLALAIRPSSFKLFASAILLRLLYTVYWMPMLRGHLFLEGLIVAGVIIGLGLELWKKKKFQNFRRQEQEELFESFASFLRITTIIVYAAVTLSKINAEFLDRQSSAAVQLLFWTATYHDWVPKGFWMQQISIWGTVIIEGGIPILLCFRKTRWMGLIIALAFHALLVLVPLKIASFSITMCLLLISWIPRESPRKIFDGFHRVVEFTRLRPGAFIIAFGFVVVITSFLYAATGPLTLQRGLLYLGLGAWWWQFLVMLAALWTLRSLDGDNAGQVLDVRSRTMKLYLLFVVFNCLCPYIGLKTRSTLTMHCNLRTERGYWNHLILPERMRVFEYQDELVTILESDLPDFDHLKKQGMELPYFEFRRWCRLAEGNFFVAYKDSNGQTKHFAKKDGIGSDSELMRRNRMLEWFFCFNPTGSSHDYIPGLVRRSGPPGNVVPHFEIPE